MLQAFIANPPMKACVIPRADRRSESIRACASKSSAMTRPRGFLSRESTQERVDGLAAQACLRVEASSALGGRKNAQRANGDVDELTHLRDALARAHPPVLL